MLKLDIMKQKKQINIQDNSLQTIAMYIVYQVI